METDRNLLFGVIALQAGLIDAGQFVDVCSLWAAHKQTSLAELAVTRGWITATDREHIEYLLERRIDKCGGDLQASLGRIPALVQQSLAAIGDPDIDRSLTRRASVDDDLDQTQVFRVKPGVPDTDERYELSELHAAGGVGRVWLAADEALERTVALKELKPELAADDVARARFHREAQITGQLEHPGIVPVYDLVDRPDGSRSFYTMRYVQGQTLADAARDFHRARLLNEVTTTSFVGLLNAFVAVCNTVAYADSRGVIHRDLKGQNIVLGSFGETVVLDWGFAKWFTEVEEESTPSSLQPGPATDSNLTIQGEVMGTPAYMSPEQAAGHLDRIDSRTDVYGLGAILYQVLTGEPPFSGATIDEVLRKVQSEPPIPPRQLWEDVPPTLEAACLRALSKDPSSRFDSAAELAREVEQWQEVQRKQAEQALRESEQLYRSLVDVLPLILVRKDLEHRFTFANKRFCEAVGLTLEELIGKTDFDVSPADLSELYQEHDRHVFETQEPLVTEEKFFERGELRDIQVIKTPTWDHRGELNGLQIIVWDVTEQKRLERALRESEAFYQALVESLPQGIVRKDAEGRVTFVNQGTCELTELSRDQLLGKTDADIFPPDLAQKYRLDDRAVMESATRLDAIEVHQTLHGSKHFVQVVKTPVFSPEGEAIGIQAVFWDVTERKRLEESLKQKDDEVQRLRQKLRQLGAQDR